MALVHQIYVYVDECLLVKSTSFGSIVRDSNTIIVRWCTPLLRHLTNAIRCLLFILYVNSYNHFIAKLFLIHSDCISLIIYGLRKISALLMKISNHATLETASHYRWRAKTIKKGSLQSSLPQWCKKDGSWKYTRYYKNNVEIVANELQ